jgi:hypothetical protein
MQSRPLPARTRDLALREVARLEICDERRPPRTIRLDHVASLVVGVASAWLVGTRQKSFLGLGSIDAYSNYNGWLYMDPNGSGTKKADLSGIICPTGDFGAHSSATYCTSGP